MGEGKGGMIWENSIKTCLLSSVKQITSPGWIHETSALGLVHWDDPEGWDGEGGWEEGSGWGTHVNPWLIHVNVWQKLLQYCKVISLQVIKIKKKKKKRKYMSALAGKRERVLFLGLEKQMPSMCKWLWCDKYGGRTLTAGSPMAEEKGWGNPPFIINLLSLKRDGKYLKYQEAWSLTRSSPSGNTHLICPKFQNITSPGPLRSHLTCQAVRLQGQGGRRVGEVIRVGLCTRKGSAGKSGLWNVLSFDLWGLHHPVIHARQNGSLKGYCQVKDSLCFGILL